MDGDLILTVIPANVAAHTPGELPLTSNTAPSSVFELFFAQLRHLGVTNVLAVTSLPEAMQRLTSLGVSAALVPSPTTTSPTQAVEYAYLKTTALRVLLAAGFNVLYADVDVLFLKPPFGALYRDSDFEAASGDDLPAQQARGYQLNV